VDGWSLLAPSYGTLQLPRIAPVPPSHVLAVPSAVPMQETAWVVGNNPKGKGETKAHRG